MPDIMMYTEFGEDERRYDFPIPAGWVVSIRDLGVEVWIHSPDGERGVSTIGRTRSEALRETKKRLEEWLGVVKRHPYDGLRRW